MSNHCVEAVTALKWRPQQKSEMVRQQSGTGLQHSVDVKAVYLTPILRCGYEQKRFLIAVPEGDINFASKSTTN